MESGMERVSEGRDDDVLNQELPVLSPWEEGTIKVRKLGGCDIGRRSCGRTWTMLVV